MEYNNNGNAELNSRVSLIDVFAGIFKSILFIFPMIFKVLEYILKLFAERKK